MADKISWKCEACDSPNTVEAGEAPVCRYCRLTYEVKIPPREDDAARTARLPVIDRIEELMSGGHDGISENGLEEPAEAEPDS